MDSVKPRVLATGSVETLREIVEEAKIERPLDSSLAFACLYTKHSKELLEYVIGICLKDFNQQDKNYAATLLTRKKQVTFEDQLNSRTDASGSQPRSNTKKNRILPAKSVNKNKVEEHPRTNKSSLKTTNRVDSSISSKRTKATGNVLTSVGYQWRPTRRIFTLGEQCPLTRLTKSKVVPAKQTEYVSTCKTMITGKLSHTSQKQLTIYQRKNQQYQAVLVSLPTSPENQAIAASMQSVIAYANQQEPKKIRDPTFKTLHLRLFLNAGHIDRPLVFGLRLLKTYDEGSLTAQEFRKKFIGTIRFGNDHFGAIMGYGDYVISDSVISRVYYVEGLGYNLFFVRQFCDSDLEVAFRKHSCYVQDTDGVELIKGSCGSNLYTISVEDMMKSSPICLLSKASKNKSWLWHCHLNHLNFGTINDLARQDLVRGLPRLKFEKDHLCSACQLRKSKKHTHTPRTENTNLEVLNTLHMDLCGPMRVQTINGKKYILVIIDDYSSSDSMLRKCRHFSPKSVPRTPQQNGIVERRNRTLVEAARTMMIFSKASMFL
ncbi:retrovirus-related pol polyprotein from transposon TNT 1-94 [Tanacetum coccineum]